MKNGGVDTDYHQNQNKIYVLLYTLLFVHVYLIKKPCY